MDEIVMGVVDGVYRPLETDEIQAPVDVPALPSVPEDEQPLTRDERRLVRNLIQQLQAQGAL